MLHIELSTGCVLASPLLDVPRSTPFRLFDDDDKCASNYYVHAALRIFLSSGFEYGDKYRELRTTYGR